MHPQSLASNQCLHGGGDGERVAGELVEVAGGESEPRGLRLIQKGKTLGVKRLVHDERSSGMPPARVTSGESHRPVRRKERTAHRAGEALRIIARISSPKS